MWQGRFSSFPLDERNFLAAARYLELHPLLAKLAKDSWFYPWSRAHAKVTGQDDTLVTVSSLLAIVPEWQEFLVAGLPEKEADELRKHERISRPLRENGL